MTVSISVRDSSCRGCELCADICPTEVFILDAPSRKMKVAHAVDCIGCLSCAYTCPSGAIKHEGVELVRDFTRNTETLKTLSKYL